MQAVRILCALFLIFQTAPVALEGQTLATAPKDPTAMAILTRSVAALGGNSAIGLSCTATGNLTIAGSSGATVPIVIKNKSSSMVRTELSLSRGQNLLILNSGVGAKVSAHGSVLHLNPNNTVFRRALHIPLFSQISEYQASTTAVEYLGVFGNVNRVALSYVPAGANQQSVTSITRTIFDLDQTTGFLTRMQYTNFAENDDATENVEIRFSDYRQTNGIAIPFKQEMYTDGNLNSTLIPISVDCQSPISASDFALPN